MRRLHEQSKRNPRPTRQHRANKRQTRIFRRDRCRTPGIALTGLGRRACVRASVSWGQLYPSQEPTKPSCYGAHVTPLQTPAPTLVAARPAHAKLLPLMRSELDQADYRVQAKRVSGRPAWPVLEEPPGQMRNRPECAARRILTSASRGKKRGLGQGKSSACCAITPVSPHIAKNAFFFMRGLELSVK